MEGDDVINTIQELRTHQFGELFACSVARHDDDSVLKVNQTTFVIGKSSVVKYLQQGVENIWMCLLNLVKEYDAIRLTTNRFGKLSALIIAYIPRRCTDKTSYTELLLILTHINSGQHILVVEEIFG